MARTNDYNKLEMPSPQSIVDRAIKDFRSRTSGRQQKVSFASLSLRDFCREAWRIVEPGTVYKTNWHLDCINEHLEACSRGELRKLILNFPPRMGKSLGVAVFWFCWTWTFHPESRWLYASYADTLSIRDSLKCRRVITSPWYQERWGDVFQLTSDQNVKGRFENTKMGYRLASSVLGANTGEGGDFIVIDDAHNVIESESDDIRERVIRWYTEVMSTRLNDPKTGVQVIVMQRVHERDLCGYLLENQEGWHHLVLPMEYEPRVYTPGFHIQPHDDCPIYSDPRTKPGELLWPDRMGPEEVADLIRTLGPYAAAGQLQQRPSPRQGALFDVSLIKPLPLDFDTPDKYGKTKRQHLKLVQGWDLAYGTKDYNDYTAAITVGVDKAGNIYILNAYRLRTEKEGLPVVMADHIVPLIPHLVGIELTAYRQSWTRDLIRLLNKKLQGRAAVAVVPVKATGEKETRAKLPAGRAQMGMLYADKSAHWWPMLERELITFPRGAHDDLVDALSLASQLAVEGVKFEDEEEEQTNTRPYHVGQGKVDTTPSWDPFKEYAKANPPEVIRNSALDTEEEET